DQEGNSDSVLLSVLPLHHAYCLTCDLLLSMRYGAVLAINDSLMRLPQNIRLFEPTMILVVPMIAETLYRRIAAAVKSTPGLTMAEAARSLFGEKLLNLFCGGAYLSPQLSEAYMEMGIPILQGYGMTECSPRIASSSLVDPSTGEDVGRVVKNCEVKIDDGEILVRSPSVMMGYYRNKEAEKEMFTEDGWLKTGDLGYVKDGRVYITGRKKNLIILSNGENISPEIIENSFADCEWLAEILVYTEGDKITAEVYARPEFAAQAEQLLKEKAEEINRNAPAARRITRLRLRDREFDKTTSRKIRRIQSGEKGRILE
ncbi:MAG: AMP-binding protein, partial [Solobacterium sp.]|nr:AMP-binding protein [Solobacterium sp.]